ncbi:hypothetical protein [Pseudoflavonifractor capillosus]|uniref:Uncharacterized protein n=1 Tax=Pseudoflavonifractor capillosus TaxID=106588 RepID=A0A921MPQ6_9FIRM|nr:hypothetical protein [Pseudoflavonifractor capillosus]HJG87811.1 hypothetical protein [Pseudoflavonifractor capillosus]
MRKEIVLPSLAVGGGIVGLLLRRWELATAFEADTGLVTPNMPSTWALIIWSALLAAAFILLCRGKHRSFAGGYDAAFAAKGNTVYITAMVLAAFLLLASAVLNYMGIPAAYAEAVAAARAGNAQGTPLFNVLPRAILGALAAVSFFCVLSTGRNNYRGEGKGKFSFPLLAPAYMGCIWLIAAYQVRAGDPVRQDYIYELFAIISSLLGLYFMAGFSFERAKVFRSSLFSLLGVYFSLVTLADGHELYVVLLYGFCILSLTANVTALLANDTRPEPRARRSHSEEEISAEDSETEVTPDEQ